ncbi:MAG: aminodeoxychorismate/anthranilate synthase component II [Bacteroidetes bacterium]|nr:MAG: aminodeoxychorismate/anthranilate synthase component II [Bacteroidota bacterium]
MLLLIDNYDSFTFNLVQLIGQLEHEIKVIRNDKITLEEIVQLNPERIVISPGPGRPEHAGICVSLIRELGATYPILGVCLGHQAIGQAFGGNITYAPSLMHGKTSMIIHQDSGIFQNMANPFEATRYHSLVIAKENFPGELRITATTDDGTIMAIAHRKHPIQGIQFHPESVLTRTGYQLIANWIAQTAK